MINKLKYYLFTFFISSCLLLNAHQKDSAIANAGFIQNNGQWDNPCAYLLNVRGAEVYFEKQAFQYFFENINDVADFFNHTKNAHLFNPKNIKRHAVRMEFTGSQPNAYITGNNPRKHHLNFIKGNDTRFWKSSVPIFNTILYKNLYAGIDAQVFQGNQNGLKYEFYVAPNANPLVIKMDYKGANRIYLKNGNLHIQTSVNNWIESKPYAYQRINGVPKEVGCKFIIQGNTVSFILDEYNTNEVLVIDPELVFSTYSGSSVDNFGHTATFDNNGNLYTAGIVRNPSSFPSGRYPVTTGAFQTVWGGGVGSWPQQGFPCDIGISKYNNEGTDLLYATYLGGNNNDYPISLIVDANEQLILLGATLSKNFPVTANAFSTTRADSFDMIITRFAADGSSLVGSTYFGGNGIDGLNTADSLLMNYADEFRGEVLVTSAGDVVLVSSTTSSNLNTSQNAYQSTKGGLQDGIIATFDNTLSTLKHCSYFGKGRHDALYSLDIDNNGDFVIAGGTQSTDFIPTPGTEWANYKGGISEGFVAKINSTLTTVSSMRYWGSTRYDQVYFVKLDPQQNVAVMGQTYDSIGITSNVYNNNRGTLFVTKFTSNLNQIIFSTQLGNGTTSNALSPSAFMVDVCGRIYGSVWAGATNRNSRYARLHQSSFVSNTNNLPVSSNALQPTTDGSDFWLFVLTSNADSLSYATFFGEKGGSDHVDGGTSRFDKRGIVYQSVCASCDFGPQGLFPTTQGSYSPNNPSDRCSNASFKIDFRQENLLTADFTISPKNGCTDSVFVFKNKSHNGQKIYWYLNNILVDSSTEYSTIMTTTGTYVMKLVIKDTTTCNQIDSISKTFNVSTASFAKFSYTKDPCSSLLFFKNESITSGNIPIPFTWYFGDGDTSKQDNPTHKYTDNGTYTVRLITSEDAVCADTAEQIIAYDSLQYKLVADYDAKDTLRCEPTWLQFTNISKNGTSFNWFVNNTLAGTNATGFDSIAQKGIYTIKLVVNDTTTCLKRDSIERTFHVFPETYPDFEWEIDSCSLAVQFSNHSVILPGDTANYLWEFGDGIFSTDNAPTHYYADTGTYMVTLTANKQFPCTHSIHKAVKISYSNSTLHANFNVEPPVLCEPVTFAAINKSYNAAKSYWHVAGDIKDSINTDYTDSIKHAGLTEIMLVVYNPNTCVPYDTSIKILNTYTSANAGFSVKRDSCSANIIISNHSTTQSHTPPSYFWEFGDGNSSTDEHPVHEYDTDGEYTITLVTNPETPCADTATRKIAYQKDAHLFTIDFLLNDSAFCTPAFISAAKTGINGKQIYWLLNDTLVSNDSLYLDTLNAAGRYSVKLVVIDSNTCLVRDTLEKLIDVNWFAVSDFIMERDSCSLNVQFINRSADSNMPLVWYFGDGDSSSEFSPKHKYEKTNTYTVSLIYNPMTICADTAEYDYFIDGDSIQEISIPNVFTPNGDGINDCYSISGVSEKCDEFYIKIYNRWGTVVYENTNGTNCWNGKNQSGTDLPQGVYYYILMIKKKDGYKLDDHGTVTLIRERND